MTYASFFLSFYLNSYLQSIMMTYIIGHTILFILCQNETVCRNPGFCDFLNVRILSTGWLCRRILDVIFTGRENQIHIWVQQRQGILLVCFFLARNDPIWKRKFFHLHFSIEELIIFKRIFAGNYPRVRKNWYQKKNWEFL